MERANERELLNKEIEDRKESDKAIERAKITDLYIYVGRKYLVILIIGVINSVLAGIVFPLKFLVFRDILGFIKYDSDNSELPGTYKRLPKMWCLKVLTRY